MNNRLGRMVLIRFRKDLNTYREPEQQEQIRTNVWE